MEGAGWAALRIHVCIVGWLGRCYPDRNLGLHAIRPINWAKALGLSLFGRRRLSNEWRNVRYLFRSMPTDNLVYFYIPMESENVKLGCSNALLRHFYSI
jgi:hypothetical protein